MRIDFVWFQDTTHDRLAVVNTDLSIRVLAFNSILSLLLYRPCNLQMSQEKLLQAFRLLLFHLQNSIHFQHHLRHLEAPSWRLVRRVPAAVASTV